MLVTGGPPCVAAACPTGAHDQADEDRLTQIVQKGVIQVWQTGVRYPA
jgi:hypothetical protein